jgi:hypothetical protein
MKINCSNCGTQITLNLAAEAAEFTTTAYGKGSKRVAAETISNPLELDSSGLVVWEAPCCTDEGGVYEDTIEPWEYPAIAQLVEGR